MDQELFAYLETYLTPRRRELFKKVLAQRTNHFTVATEGVYQLHNTSAVVRSCDVYGIQNIHVVEEIEGNRIDKEIAMGAQKWVDINRYTNIKQCILHLKSQGYAIVATTPHGNTVTPKTFNIEQKSAFFFGKEGDGLSNYVLDQADVHLAIPMYGFTESLNISVAAAIILYELVIRLKASDVEWQLTANEQLAKRMDWTCATIKSADKIIERFLEARKIP